MGTEKEEEIRKLRINNQKEVSNLLKDMEEKNTKDGKLIDKLKTNLSQKEKDLKRTTMHLNKLLRDRDHEMEEKEKAFNKLKQLNELFDPERNDKKYTEEEYIPQVIEKNLDTVETQEDIQEEIQETLNVSGDIYSLSTIEPIS